LMNGVEMKTIIATAFVTVFIATRAFADTGDAHHEHEHQSVGKPGDRAKVSRTIEIDMSDSMRFTPSRITVKKGATVRFVVKNSGKVKHEMVIGTAKELREHAAMMQKHPEMEHEEPNEITLDPGKSGELVWQFTKAGTIEFACLQPGHFESGMRGNVVVR
jgi:uncharacterized cupredoxin-like copper-binding protein